MVLTVVGHLLHGRRASRAGQFCPVIVRLNPLRQRETGQELYAFKTLTNQRYGFGSANSRSECRLQQLLLLLLLRVSALALCR